MQFSTIFTVLAVAMTASAAALPGNGGGGDTSVVSCSSIQQNTCCQKTDGLLSVLDITCSVNVIGGNCNGQAYCCESDSSGSTAVGFPFPTPIPSPGLYQITPQTIDPFRLTHPTSGPRPLPRQRPSQLPQGRLSVSPAPAHARHRTTRRGVRVVDRLPGRPMGNIDRDLALSSLPP